MARKKIKVKLKPAKKGKSFTERVVGPLDGIHQDVVSMSKGVQKGVKKIPGVSWPPKK